MRRAGPAADPLHRRSLPFRQHGVGIQLEVLEGVFAGAGVDAGTRQLLRRLGADSHAGARTVLDLGCGYGPLGLWLAAARPDRTLVAVDRDARALEATVLGAAANGLGDRVTAVGSLGYDSVGPDPFDLVVSNIPAKVGPAALAHLVLDACWHLTEQGSVAIVVVDRLAGAVRALLDEPAVVVEAVHPTASYTVFEYRFAGRPLAASAEPSFDRGLYQRATARFGAAGLAWSAAASFSIPEFDSLAHGTIAAVEALQEALAGPSGRGPEPVVVVGAGQGHVALALRAAGVDRPIRLVDRDLLALRTAAANLGEAGGVELRHVARPGAGDVGGACLAVVELPEREPVAITAAVLGGALAGLGAGGLVLHGRAADLARVVELLRRHGIRLEVAGRHKVRGHGAIRARIRDR